MSEIYDAISQVGDNPWLEQDFQAYKEAMATGDNALAAEILKDASHVARQIKNGMLSGRTITTPSSIFAPADEPTLH